MVKKISIRQFVEMSSSFPLIDVRSPGEFTQAHVPGAYALPLFTDEERKVVGTAYKNQGRQKAIKIGLEYFGPRMNGMVEEVESLMKNKQLAISNGQNAFSQIDSEYSATPSHAKEILPVVNCLLLYCWRGGMRSAGVAWLLDLYGFEVYTLAGGYKAYRNWVLQQFEKEYQLNVIGGYTGSAKTKVLQQLEQKQQTIIDLEAIANHKGSAFGGIGQPRQPTQEMFENILATRLDKIRKESELNGFPAWIEDESQRIGVLNIPHSFWKNMRNQPIFFIDIPFLQRLDYIMHEYGSLDKEKLTEAILRIQKRLGPLETKITLAELTAGNTRECFRILLNYYDKLYDKGLHNRENIDRLLNKIPHSAVDIISITEKLLSCEPAYTRSFS